MTEESMRDHHARALVLKLCDLFEQFTQLRGDFIMLNRLRSELDPLREAAGWQKPKAPEPPPGISPAMPFGILSPPLAAPAAHTVVDSGVLGPATVTYPAPAQAGPSGPSQEDRIARLERILASAKVRPVTPEPATPTIVQSPTEPTG